MSAPSERIAFSAPLPPSAEPALRVVRRLHDAGHTALLAGGCVRDLLLGARPQDFDVATDATPDQVCALFRGTRRVGAQFGVVLVRQRRTWVEVATFREDCEYVDGRRPEAVQYSDARHDAQRRDFTINGMFLDPLAQELIDYVGGRDDLAARLVRAIGDPARRFSEDHLRLLRAVRFAARLGFKIEPATLEAIRALGDRLARVAAERRREELDKMFAHSERARALSLLVKTDLLPHVASAAPPAANRIEQAVERFARLPADAPAAAAWALLLAGHEPRALDALCGELRFSNEDRATVVWLVRHQADLDNPQHLTLAEFKRLLAHPAFALLRMVADARCADRAEAERRRRQLDDRIAAIAPAEIKPPPLVTGDDLAARGVAPGPIYKRVLDALYERQLNERLPTREAALEALDEMLAREERSGGT